MIKISRVMTVYTIKLLMCMCITPFNTYTTFVKMKYFIYVLQAKYINIELASNSF